MITSYVWMCRLWNTCVQSMMVSTHGLRSVKLESTKIYVIRLKNKIENPSPWIPHRTVVKSNLVRMINSHSFEQINLEWYTYGFLQFWIKLFFGLFPSPSTGSTICRSWSRQRVCDGLIVLSFWNRQGTLGDRVLAIREKKNFGWRRKKNVLRTAPAQ